MTRGNVHNNMENLGIPATSAAHAIQREDSWGFALENCKSSAESSSMNVHKPALTQEKKPTKNGVAQQSPKLE